MQRGSSLHRGTDEKKRKIETGLRTPEDQAVGPVYIPSELLDSLRVWLKRIFTYLYNEVLRFVAKLP